MDHNPARSYQYYQNLGFENYAAWSQDDLSRFLVDDFQEAFRTTTWFKDLPVPFLKESEALANQRDMIGVVLSVFDRMKTLLRKLIFFKKRKKILFYNSKYRYLISLLRQWCDVGVLVQGKRDKVFLSKDFSVPLDVQVLHGLMVQYLEKKDITCLHQIIEKCQKALARVKPDAIVLGSDVFPIERALIIAAKKLGIPTLAIQHGIYDTSLPLIDFGAADGALVWGEHFKKLYVSHGVRPEEDIYVLGYPHHLEKYSEQKKSLVPTMCYLGQDYEKFSKELLSVKLQTVKGLADICQRVGWNFVYRPHPGDDIVALSSFLPSVAFTPPNQPLEQTFQEADIFISFSSTSLVEAAMRGKLCVQLRNYPIDTDNFETLGASTKSFQTLPEIEGWLQGAGKHLPRAKHFNNEYIENRYNPGQQFMNILNAIEAKRKKRPRVGIVHPGLEAGGGSESSTVWMGQALKDDYDVVFISTGTIDLPSLNKAYGTSLTNKDVDLITMARPRFFAHRFSALRNGFPRFCKRLAPQFELMISGYNPMDFGRKGMQIIADLNFDWGLSQRYNVSRDFQKVIYQDSLLRNLYLWLSKKLAPDSRGWKNNVTISLSQWLADKFKEEFGVVGSVVYPPVPDDLPNHPFEQREDGFVLLCRISPEKEVEKVIAIIKGLRDHNPNIHLHIVGRMYESQLAYGEYIKQLCQENKDWCFYEGPLYGREKLDFIARHKYGISGRTYEPWGITVAEMAKAGSIVFVPNGGGQVEIVNHPKLVFDDEADAVKKIFEVTTNKALENELQVYLKEQGSHFTNERFVREIKRVVDDFFINPQNHEES